MPRGRSQQAVRPGHVIKAVLTGQQPLITPPKDEESTVTEACATDIHYTYQRLIDRENQGRQKGARLKGLRVLSFNTVWRFLRVMGLIEFVREEPMLSPPPRGTLLTVGREEGGFTIRTAARRIYRLTDFGAQEEVAWSDITSAYKDFIARGGELWPEPRKVVKPIEEVAEEVAAPPVVVEKPPVPTPPKVPKPKARKAPRKPKVEVKFALGPRPTPTQFRILLEYIPTLEGLRSTNPDEFVKQMDYISNRVGDWHVEAEDVPERYGRYLDYLVRLYQAVDTVELDEMKHVVEEMIQLSTE